MPFSNKTIYFNTKYSNDLWITINSEIITIFQMLVKGQPIHHMYISHYDPNNFDDRARIYLLQLLIDNIYINSNIQNHTQNLQCLTNQHMFSPISRFYYNIHHNNSSKLMEQCIGLLKHKLEIKPSLTHKLFLNKRTKRKICDLETKQPIDEQMKKEGFIVVYIEDIDNLYDFIELFSKSSIIISPRTTILTNLLFTHKDTIICEINSMNYPTSPYQKYSKNFIRYNINEMGPNYEYLILHKQLLKKIYKNGSTNIAIQDL